MSLAVIAGIIAAATGLIAAGTKLARAIRGKSDPTDPPCPPPGAKG